MPCMFCNHIKLSKEHLFGSWVRKVIPYDLNTKEHTNHTITTYNEDGEPFIRKGAFANSGSVLSRTTKVVCSTCNNTWMSQIENSMVSIFEKNFTQKRNEWLSPEEQCSLKNWLYLKFCLFQRSYGLHEWKPHIPKTTFKDIDMLEKNSWKNYYAMRAIPHNILIYVCKIPFNYPYSSGSHQYIPLIGLYANKNTGRVSGYKIDYFFMLCLGELCAVFRPKIWLSDSSKWDSIVNSSAPLLSELKISPTKDILLTQNVDPFIVEDNLLSLIPASNSMNKLNLKRNFKTPYFI